MNSLVRKSIPKGTGFQRVTDSKVKEVQGRRNACPDVPAHKVAVRRKRPLLARAPGV